MTRFRNSSTIPFTASQFRIGEPNAISFSTRSPTRSSLNESSLNHETASPADAASYHLSRGTKTVDLAIPGRKKDRTNLVHPFIRHQPTWFSTVAFILCFLLVNHCHSNIVRSLEQHLACMFPSKVSQVILQSSRQCDWHQTAFSRLVPFGRDFASLNKGGIVSPRLTTSGIDSVPPSAVLSNTTEVCWSFRGNSGMFGVAFDEPNVMPTHVVIHHWPSNSTASLSRAPRQVIVWGLVDGEANMKAFSRSQRAFTSTLAKVPPSPISKEGIFLPLAEIDFDITARSLRQAFPVSKNALLWGIDFGVIVLDIRSNWGADTTSLCTVHVYGRTVPVDRQDIG
ncbi:hypothetical protein H4582DRAFT_1975874 [Lactarius indigo]|nr:hypothetical protein H4582DRAFT_1975874 [Lactarius indigo]